MCELWISWKWKQNGRTSTLRSSGNRTTRDSVPRPSWYSHVLHRPCTLKWYEFFLPKNLNINLMNRGVGRREKKILGPQDINGMRARKTTKRCRNRDCYSSMRPGAITTTAHWECVGNYKDLIVAAILYLLIFIILIYYNI